MPTIPCIDVSPHDAAAELFLDRATEKSVQAMLDQIDALAERTVQRIVDGDAEGAIRWLGKLRSTIARIRGDE